MTANPPLQRFALITGAGDGLGRALALECAARGYHLLLVDIPGKSLERLAWHLEANYNITVRCIGVDLCADDCAEKIGAFIEEQALPMGMLINNAGMGHHRLFEMLDPEYVQRLLQLNIMAVTRITHTLIPHLKKHPESHIINISSLACFYTVPLKSIYAASKGYIRSLSMTLRTELKPLGIKVSVVCPAGINTNIYQYFTNRNGGWLVRNTLLEPDEVARIAIKNALRGKGLIIPGRLNQWLFQIVKLIPAYIKTAISVKILRHSSQGRQQKKGTLPGITMDYGGR